MRVNLLASSLAIIASSTYRHALPEYHPDAEISNRPTCIISGGSIRKILGQRSIPYAPGFGGRRIARTVEFI